MHVLESTLLQPLAVRLYVDQRSLTVLDQFDVALGANAVLLQIGVVQAISNTSALISWAVKGELAGDSATGSTFDHESIMLFFDCCHFIFQTGVGCKLNRRSVRLGSIIAWALPPPWGL
jgi:hypothetical protein